MTRLIHVPGIVVLALCTSLATPGKTYAQTFGGQHVTLPQALAPSEASGLPALTHQSLFGGILSDFKHLESKDTLLILSVGAAAAAVAHPFDGQPLGSPPAHVSGAYAAGNVIGSTYVQLGGALGTYALGKLTHSTGTTAFGADLLRAQILASAVTQGIKISAGRTRPDGTQFSFPSGHTSSAFATATVIERHFGWKAGVPAYGVAAYVAASRVGSKRHYLSDVTFGAALGLMAGRTVTLGRGNARFELAPAAAPGGAGVNFTWVGRK